MLTVIERLFLSIDSSTSKEKDPLRKCVVCAKYKRQQETRYMPEDCVVALCVTPCLATLHTHKQKNVEQHGVFCCFFF